MKESIYIGFSKASNNNLLSRIIMLVERTNFSHAYIRIPSPYLERDFYFQASGLMVNFMGTEQFKLRETVVREFEFEISEESKKKLWQFAIDNAGKPYAIKQLFGDLWVVLGKLLGKRWKNPFPNGQNMFVCIEIDYAVMQNILGIDLKIDPDSIDLYDVYKYLDNR